MEGNITGLLDSTTITLTQGNLTKDVAYSKNGKFELKTQIGEVPEALNIMLSKDSTYWEYTSLFAADEAMKLDGNTEMKGSEFTLTGSVHEDLSKKMDEQLKPFREQRNALIGEMMELRNDGKWNDDMQIKYWGDGEKETGLIGAVDEKTDAIERVFIKENINSFNALQMLTYSRDLFENEELKELYNAVTDENIRKSKYAEVLSHAVNADKVETGKKRELRIKNLVISYYSSFYKINSSKAILLC